MNTAKRLTPLAAVMAMFGAYTTAHADVNADVSVASTYLWRGIDQSDGNAQVAGTLSYTADSGAYVSAWGSSYGGENASQTYELNMGYAHQFETWQLDAGVINYVYPKMDTADSIGDESEAYIGASYKGFEVYYFKNIAGLDNGFSYLTASYAYQRYSLLLGYADPTEPKGQSYDNNYLHADFSSAFNDSLSFTLSEVVDVDDEAMVVDEVLFVVR